MAVQYIKTGFFSRYFKELKSILFLSIPIFMTQLGMTAMGFIDTVMAGHYSKTALAAVAIGSSLFFPFIISLNGIMMALVAITAQLKGGKNDKKAIEILSDSFWIGLFFAGLLFLFFTNPDYVLKIMNLDPDVSRVVKGYLSGIAAGIPAVSLYLCLKSFIEGLGKTRPEMFISFISVFFNFFANNALIYGKFGFKEMGGAGCGLATGLTFWLFFILMLFYYYIDKEVRKMKIYKKIRFPDFEGVKEILSLGIPIGGTLFMECSIFACITLFIGVLGPAVVGGHQITLNYSSLVFCFPLSVGMAVTIRAGHELGRNNPSNARFSCIAGISFAMTAAFCTLVFTRFCPELIASFYTDDSEVKAIAVSLLKTAALYQISDAIMVISQSGLRGYKDANVTFLLTFAAYWVITLPIGYVISMTDWLVSPMGANGFWLSLIFGLSVSGVFLGIRLNYVSKKYL
ncbi:MAG: MATE family efflux transporter [Desulfobacteraceae bacterium]|nr:MATE family efflux transporter [Desulfobacteraceae bacterium]